MNGEAKTREPEDDGLRLFLFRQRRPRTLGEASGELWTALAALASLSPRWRTWQTRDDAYRIQRVMKAGDCERFLRDARIERDGRPVPGGPTYRLDFLSKGTEQERAEVSLLFAVAGDAVKGWRGLRIRAQLGARIREPPEVALALAHEVFAAMVRAFRPDWAFLGTPSTPDPRWEQSSTPEVGWLTYLSMQANGAPFRERFPNPKDAPPPSLPSPATVDAVDDLGWIVAVGPELIRPGDAAQHAALDDVRRGLGARVRQEEPKPVQPPAGPPVRLGPLVGPSPWAAYAGDARLADETDATCEMRVDAALAPALPFSDAPVEWASLAAVGDARGAGSNCGATMVLPVFPAEPAPAFKEPESGRRETPGAGTSRVPFRPAPPTMVLPAFGEAEVGCAPSFAQEGAASDGEKGARAERPTPLPPASRWQLEAPDDIDRTSRGGLRREDFFPPKRPFDRARSAEPTAELRMDMLHRALPFAADEASPGPAPQPSGPPGKRLVRFDTQTGEPLPIPVWVDAPTSVPSGSKQR
jgi:hypothetical protein